MHPSLSLEKSKIKILLLEGVDPSAVESLKKAGYTSVEYLKKALDGQELLSNALLYLLDLDRESKHNLRIDCVP